MSRGASRAIRAHVTPANPVAYVRLDEFRGAALAVQATIGSAVMTSVQSASDAATTKVTPSNNLGQHHGG